MVFPNTKRTDNTPALYSENFRDYLQRSSTIEAKKVRDLIEDMYLNFPSKDKLDILSRLRSSKDRQHLSAFHEIYLAYILRKFRYKISVHPLLKNSARRPDFKVSKFLHRTIILEATTAFHESLEREAATKRENVVYDVLNQMNSPDFWLGIKIRGAPDTPPKARMLRSQLSNWLGSLNWKSLRYEVEKGNNKALPIYSFIHEGWSLRIRALPKPPELRGQPGVRPIGSQFGEFRISNAKNSIRKSIVEKARAYGNQPYPYIIAINSFGIHTNREDIIEALYGSLSYLVSFDSESNPIPTRNRDGVWIGPDGPCNSHISAVLVNNRLSPWRVSRSDPVLYINPMATMKIRGPITKLNRVVISREKTVDKKGVGASEIFGLPIEWPENFEVA